MQGKPAIKFNGKTVAIFNLAVVGALVLGVEMCMTMVWQDFDARNYCLSNRNCIVAVFDTALQRY